MNTAKRMAAESLPGFSEFAAFRASNTERSIYRRFKYLSALNLVFMESQLDAMEKELRRLDEEDINTIGLEDSPLRDHVLLSSKSFSYFQANMKTDERCQLRWDLMLRVRDLIKDYQAALQSENQSLALRSPPPRCLKLLKTFLWNKGGLLPDEAMALEEANIKDMVTTDPASDNDRLSNLVETAVTKWRIQAFRDWNLPGSWGDLYDSSNDRVTMFVTLCNVVMTCALMTGAMVSLHPVTNEYARIAIVAVFTAAFAVTVGFLMQANRADVLAGTAAYASVLVIYVAGGFNSS